MMATQRHPSFAHYGPTAIPNGSFWRVARVVMPARRYRTITIQVGPHTITAANPVPGDLREALTKINNASRTAH